MRSVPLVHGHVSAVGADAVTPHDGSAPYFSVRVEFDQQALDQVPEVQLVAGMPTELFILGTPRTPISLFLTPIRGFIRRAFRD